MTYNDVEAIIKSEEFSELRHINVVGFMGMATFTDNQNKIKRQGPNLTLELEKIGNRPSGELSSSVPLIQRTISAATFFGEKPILIRGSNNSNIPISKGIPSVTIGCGGKGGKVHSLDEWWINEEGYKAIQMALLIVLSETGF